MAGTAKLYLFDTNTHQQTHEVSQDGLDVFFPAGISWSEVLDCRIAPYDARPVEENCEYAAHVRKQYILVTLEQVQRAAPLAGDQPPVE